MNLKIALMLIALQAVLMSPAWAKPSAKGKPSRSAAKIESSGPRENLSRDIRFGDSAVYGKYQYANEGTAEIESEKTLDGLLGVRTDFKDRLKLETQRR